MVPPASDAERNYPTSIVMVVVVGLKKNDRFKI